MGLPESPERAQLSLEGGWGHPNHLPLYFPTGKQADIRRGDGTRGTATDMELLTLKQNRMEDRKPQVERFARFHTGSQGTSIGDRTDALCNPSRSHADAILGKPSRTSQ